jgi:long-subunit acyl-CoA synthetase (AMP-forming)
LIQKAFVVGDNQSFLAAVIVPSDPDCPAGQLQQEMARINSAAADEERVRKYVVADEPFSIENGLLTSQFKIKRKEVAARYQAQIAAMYG